MIGCDRTSIPEKGTISLAQGYLFQIQYKTKRFPNVYNTFVVPYSWSSVIMAFLKFIAGTFIQAPRFSQQTLHKKLTDQKTEIHRAQVHHTAIAMNQITFDLKQNTTRRTLAKEAC